MHSTYGKALERLLASVDGGALPAAAGRVAVLQRPGLSGGCLAGLVAQLAAQQHGGATAVRILSMDERVLQLAGYGAAAGADVAVLRWAEDGALFTASNAATAASSMLRPPKEPLPARLLPDYWAMAGHLLPDYWALAGHLPSGAPGVPAFGEGRARSVAERLAAAGIRLGAAGLSPKRAAKASKWMASEGRFAAATYGAVMSRVLGAQAAPLGEAAALTLLAPALAPAAAVPLTSPSGVWRELTARAAVADPVALEAALEVAAAAAAPYSGLVTPTAAAAELPKYIEILDYPVELRVNAAAPTAAIGSHGAAAGIAANPADAALIVSYSLVDDAQQLDELVSYLTASLDRNQQVFISWEPPPAPPPPPKKKRSPSAAATANQPPEKKKRSRSAAATDNQPPSIKGDEDPNAPPCGLAIAWPAVDPAGAAATSKFLAEKAEEAAAPAGTAPAGGGGGLLAVIADRTGGAEPSEPPSSALPRWCLVTHDLKHFARQCGAAGARLPAPPAPGQYFDTLAAGYVFEAERFKPAKGIKPDSVQCLATLLGCPQYPAVRSEMAAALAATGADSRVAAAAKVAHNALCYVRLRQLMLDARSKQAAAAAAAASGGGGGTCGRHRHVMLDPCALIEEVEVPVQVVLAEMEMAGVGVDVAAMRRLDDQVRDRMQQLTQEAAALAAEQVDFCSPEGKCALFEGKLGLVQKARAAGEKIKMTPKGHTVSMDRTNLDILEKYDKSGLVRLAIEYAQQGTLISSYTTTFLAEVDPVTSRIYPTYDQVSTATGRLSTPGANLMAIPNAREDFDGAKEFRSTFVAPPGRLLLSADYSQVELRVLAHITRDPVLVDAFVGGRDVHRTTASKLFRIPPEQVSGAQRQAGKRVNFGLVYGMGYAKLARDIGAPLEQANNFIKTFKESFATMRAEMNAMKAAAFVTGFATSLCGRRRHFRGRWRPGGRLALWEARARAAPDTPETQDWVEREVLAILGVDALAKRETDDSTVMRELGNMRFQGSTSDIAKAAMVNTVRQLTTRGSAARLLLMVHDELIFEVPEGEVDEVATTVKAVMEATAQLSVPLEVGVEVGPNLGDLKEYLKEDAAQEQPL
ncbi:hypothetical protein GPECTOR_5g198 [Gonium pectorale]|uniref:DNA-directed DNA polymerase n=1 Tax=Gonium pectorale TaxID=33097 RepID=A0A150GWF0_GONPE|nr:hypothetical protein GPECTOR_5g198 [Gonium pectorale]|eukprot:KXZ54093.1 hypothetical protein GPECTOR_5g198 [Gonium pectorale]